MAIGPTWLESVAADELPADQLETRRGVADVRPRNVAEDVRFAATARAWTGATEPLQRQIRFDAVVPRHGELVADQLHVFDSERHERHDSIPANVVANPSGLNSALNEAFV